MSPKIILFLALVLSDNCNAAIVYRAPHSADGHADRCTAPALALRAGQGQSSCGPIFLFPHLDNRVNTSLFQ
jgi:hypothetical protein